MPEQNEPFVHSTPELYDQFMGPLLFEPYARLLAEHCARLQPKLILEIAAGTGILTRALAEALPKTSIIATDLNEEMLRFAMQKTRFDGVAFQPNNAMDLHYRDACFDLVVCQFGIMFFPDRVQANREAFRVLKPGGHYLFLTFDEIARNPVPRAAGRAVSALFPDRPLEYMQLGPFSYSDPNRIREDLVAANFTDIEIKTCGLTTHVKARKAAIGLVLGSPLRLQIEQRDPSMLSRAVEAVTESLREWDDKDAPMSAHLAIATK